MGSEKGCAKIEERLRLPECFVASSTGGATGGVDASLAVSLIFREPDMANHFPGTEDWWRRLDSNQRPRDYETLALAT